tara:strand:- start:4780 stop:6933 length:2154 start_codon:yes stop_codon:yes gene_type:complete
MATGSLLGKADATLVGAAEKQAVANVPSDLGDIYQSEAITAKLFQTEINTFFDDLYAEHNELSDNLNASVATVTENLSAGTMPNDEQIDLYMNHINGLKDKLKTIPKGPKGERERQKITAELNRLKSSTDQMDATLTDLTTKINNNDYIPNATGSNNMKLLTAISNGSAKQEIVNGNLVYTLPGTDLRITQSDLKKMVVSNDPTVNENFNKITSSAYDLANVDGVDWSTERQGIINNYEKAFNTREGYAQNIHQKQGNMQFTFAEILTGKGDPAMNMKIFEELKELGVEVPEDVDGDGKITEKDFANPENGIALIRSLTDISDPNFNFQAAKKIAAEFYTDNIAAKEFQEAGGTIGGEGMSDFEKAFAKARKDGVETFIYNGKEYGTELGEDDGSGGSGTDKQAPAEITSMRFGTNTVPKKEVQNIWNMINSTSTGDAQAAGENLEFSLTDIEGKEHNYTWVADSGTWSKDGEVIGKGNPADIVNSLGWSSDKNFAGVTKRFVSEDEQLGADQKYNQTINLAATKRYYKFGDWTSAASGKSNVSGDNYGTFDVLQAKNIRDGNPNRDNTGTAYANMERANSSSQDANAIRKSLVQSWSSRSAFFKFSTIGKNRYTFEFDEDRVKKQYGPGFVNWLKDQSSTGGATDYGYLLAGDLTGEGTKHGGGKPGFKWSYDNGGAKKSLEMMSAMTNKYMVEIGKAMKEYDATMGEGSSNYLID